MRTISILGLALATQGGQADPSVEELKRRVAHLEQQVARLLEQGGAATNPSREGPTAKSQVGPERPRTERPIHPSAQKGIDWLLSVQGPDGGWGQDGGREGDPRPGAALESQGNDLANTSLAALAILRSGSSPSEGPHREALVRAIEFVLARAEAAPREGLDLGDRQGTQIQRKLGPHIGIFLANMLLSQVDGHAPERLQARMRSALEKCVAKIQKGQLKDGSWNYGGGWAPVIGTSIASRGLDSARQKGLRVDPQVLANVDKYTNSNFDSKNGEWKVEGAAGVPLYQAAQALEQSSREAASSAPKAAEMVRAAKDQLKSARFLGGFGSMGGEEFVSYLNISDSLARSGGDDWVKWNDQIKERLVKLQNQDGTWAGHHCITGRVACTSAAVMTLLADRIEQIR